MRSVRYNRKYFPIEIYRGDTYNLLIREHKYCLDPSGDRIVFTVKDSKNQEVIKKFLTPIDECCAVLDLSSEETNIQEDTYYYDVRVITGIQTDATGDRIVAYNQVCTLMEQSEFRIIAVAGDVTGTKTRFDLTAEALVRQNERTNTRMSELDDRVTTEIDEASATIKTASEQATDLNAQLQAAVQQVLEIKEDVEEIADVVDEQSQAAIQSAENAAASAAESARYANLACQGAANAGFISASIDENGHLKIMRTGNSNIDIRLRNGRLEVIHYGVLNSDGNCLCQ